MNDQHPDLSELLRGELTNAAALATAEHARGCARCRSVLVDDALGHSLLTSARRTLADGVHEGEAPGTPVVRPLSSPPGAKPVRRSRPLLVAAAVLVLLATAAGVAVGVHGLRGGGSTARPAAQRTATLEPVDGSATGTVSMGTDHEVTRMRLATRALPHAPSGDFYYAWLFDPRTQKMLPLGQVSPGHVATFEVPQSLVAAYSAVDVSLEADDGDPAHSATSVLRATYGAPS